MPTDPGTGILYQPNTNAANQHQTEAYYEGLLRKDPKWGPKYANAYANYVKAHPGHTPYENLMLFIGEITAKGIAKVIQETSGLLGQVPGAAAKGAENAISSLDVLGKFNLGSWFLRIAEILVGLVLIGVGMARITGAANVVTKALKSGKVVPIPI